MDTLIQKHRKKIAHTSSEFVRSAMHDINWNARLIGIKGARGVGKTTLMLQFIKLHHENDPNALYVSLDDIYFSSNKLVNFADGFVKQGGKRLFLDEVHKYSNWAQEIKNIYDDLPELQVVFTGSSLLEILNARADLSRRAIPYTMQGLSFREYVNLVAGAQFQALTLTDIFKNHEKLSTEIVSQIKPLQYFQNYLKDGYYPFFMEDIDLYHIRLSEIINMILEIELPYLRGVDVSYVPKIKQLLHIISQSVPFVPNVSKLSERIGINRNTLITYLNYLAEACITKHVYRDTMGIGKLQKPEKIYLENSNFAFSLQTLKPNIGMLRETFFMNQVSFKNEVTLAEKGDFNINNQFIVEIGGKNKTKKQINGLADGFVVLDDIEYGVGNKIPLWLFGFLY